MFRALNKDVSGDNQSIVITETYEREGEEHKYVYSVFILISDGGGGGIPTCSLETPELERITYELGQEVEISVSPNLPDNCSFTLSRIQIQKQGILTEMTPDESQMFSTQIEPKSIMFNTTNGEMAD